MPMPDFIKKKIAAREAAEEESASDEEASEEESADAPVAAKKGGKMNPLMMWAKKNQG
jgi:hypothetical protein